MAKSSSGIRFASTDDFASGLRRPKFALRSTQLGELSRRGPCRAPKLTNVVEPVIQDLLLRLHALVGTGSDAVGKLVRETLNQAARIV